MKTIDEIRRDNARALAEKCGGNQEFSNKIDREPTQVSRFIGKNATKNIGDSLARHIEECTRMPRGWLDHEHSDTVREQPATYTALNDVPVYTLKELDNNQQATRSAIMPCTGGPNTFGLMIEGDPTAANPMHPQYGRAYPVGSIVFADPDQAKKTEHGDIVLAILTTREKRVTAFRQYYSEGGTELLMPLNPQFPPVSEPFEIVAKIIGAVLP